MLRWMKVSFRAGDGRKDPGTPRRRRVRATRAGMYLALLGSEALAKQTQTPSEVNIWLYREKTELWLWRYEF